MLYPLTVMVSSPSEDPDRPRGILSPSDREFLLASDEEREENYSRPGRSKRLRAIRERTVHALLDCRLIYDHMDADERAQIYEAIASTRQWESAIIAALVVVYEASGRLGRTFQWLLDNAIRPLKTDTEDGTTVSIEYTETEVPKASGVLQSATQKIKRDKLDDLTDKERKQFLQYYTRSQEFDADIPARVQQRLHERLRESANNDEIED